MSRSPAVQLSGLASKHVTWLWEGRIPLGKLAVLDGEPGVGKTNLALHLAARVSKGSAMPLSKGASAYPVEPANVLLFNADDTLADTILPRLEAASADLGRIWAVDRPITQEDIEEYKPRLIIIDSLSAYLCVNEDLPPRQSIKSLSTLARESGAALLGIQDLPDKDAHTNYNWYVEIMAAARVVLMITALDAHLRRLAVSKTNLMAVNDAMPVVYRHESVHDVIKITGWSDHL